MSEPLTLTFDYLGASNFGGEISTAISTVKREPLEDFQLHGRVVSGHFKGRINWTNVWFTIDLARPVDEAFTELRTEHQLRPVIHDIAGSRPYLTDVVGSAGFIDLRLKLEYPQTHHHCNGNLDPIQVTVWRVLRSIADLQSLIRHRCLQQFALPV